MSARKNTLAKFQIISAGDMSGNLTSSVTQIEFMDNIGIQINVAGGASTGEFFVDVSADHVEQNGNVITAGNWVQLTLDPTATVTAGNPTSIYIDLNQLSTFYIRLRYTAGSGTGTCNAFIIGKML